MNHIQYLLELHSIVFCICVVIFYLFSQREKARETKLIVWVIGINVVDLYADIMAYSQQGVETLRSLHIHIVSNFVLYTLEYVEFVILIYYLVYIIKKYTGKEYKLLFRITCACEATLQVLLIANLKTGWMFYFDSSNYYHRGPLFFLSVATHTLIMGACIRLVAIHRKHLPRALFTATIFYFLCPLLGILLQTLFFGFSFFNVAVSISVVCFYILTVLSVREENKKREQILLQTQTSLMGAQMNPHFIFNSLGAICYLIEEDPVVAEEALLHFSSYIRKSIDLDPNKGLVSLSNELELTQEYVYMEQLRFGDQIQVRYDIQVDELRLPYMTIEPIVENAIKHGLRKKRMGQGLVEVRVWKEGAFYYLNVKDNGVGFDPDKVTEGKSRRSIGINNVRERVRILCGGNMRIDSQVGAGTSVLITIPEVKR